MDWDRFWDHSFWDRAKKLSAVAGIGALFVAVAWFAYTVWKDRSSGQPASGGSTVNLWTPTFVIGACVVLAAILHLMAAYISRRKLYRRFAELNAEKNSISLALDDTTRSLTEEITIALNARNEANKIREDLAGKKQQMKEVQRERDRYKTELAHEKKMRESEAVSYETKAHEVRERADERDKCVAALKETARKVENLTQQVATSQREAEAQRNRADSEVHDKSLVRELKNRAEAELADLAFLKELAKQQASDLSTYVKTEILTHPHCGELQLTGKHLCILLGVSIQNESVFDIAIEEKQITGQFSLDRVAFKEQAGQLIDDFRPPLHDLKPRQRETILIEQPLLAFEAEKIERFLADDPEAKFSIGALGIPISINNAGFSATNAPFLRFRGGEVPLKYFKRNTDNP